MLEESRIPVTTVVLAEAGRSADWTVTVLEERVDRTVFRLDGPDGRELVTSVPLLGRHMASNAGLAIVMLVEAGFDLEAIGQALGDDGIEAFLPGRIERVSGSGGLRSSSTSATARRRSAPPLRRCGASPRATSSWSSPPTAIATTASARRWGPFPRSSPTISS
ncbi:hypothetical protein GCM10025874_05600 [Arenivirga flava]|uniref:Uncharacterized protein n=1 Tax=Arenivirga flava TaxID=1930060 RepID=A0AA37UR73_9MICO|nr:hypothetical protein GCM10025874_05600 [Arenivirga flava]